MYCLLQQAIISDVNNGVVFDLGYVDGDTINPGVKLFSIMDLDGRIVKANVAEEFIKERDEWHSSLFTVVKPP